MIFEEFCNKVKGSMEAYFGEENPVFLKTMMKNNGKELTGLIIQGENGEAMPTVYLEYYYDRYCDELSFSEVMKEIIDLIENHRGMKVDMDFFYQYDRIKSQIVCKLIHYQRNEKLLADVPHVQWEDLAIVFYCNLHHPQLGDGSILIRNEHQKIWEVTVEELYQAAMENSPHLLEEDVIPLERLLGEMPRELMGDEAIPTFFVLTNQSRVFGASALLYSRKMKELAEHAESNLFIIPSSVHECILVPDDGAADADWIRYLIKEVNETQVAPQEVLSDTLYYYDREMETVVSYC